MASSYQDRRRVQGPVYTSDCHSFGFQAVGIDCLHTLDLLGHADRKFLLAVRDCNVARQGDDSLGDLHLDVRARDSLLRQQVGLDFGGYPCV